MKRLTLILICFFVLMGSMLGGDFCPEPTQAVLLTKVISYTNQISGAPKSNVVLGVLNGGSFLGHIKKAVGSSGDNIAVKQVSQNDLQDVNVIYVPKGTSKDIVQTVSQLAKQKKVFTVAGDPDFLIQYDMTLTFHLVNNKARMVIGLNSAEEEGVKFNATLLKIAEKK